MSQSVIHGILYLIDPVKKTIFLTDHMTNKKLMNVERSNQFGQSATRDYLNNATGDSWDI